MQKSSTNNSSEDTNAIKYSPFTYLNSCWFVCSNVHERKIIVQGTSLGKIGDFQLHKLFVPKQIVLRSSCTDLQRHLNRSLRRSSVMRTDLNLALRNVLNSFGISTLGGRARNIKVQETRRKNLQRSKKHSHLIYFVDKFPLEM